MNRRRSARGNSLITILFLSTVLMGLVVYSLAVSKSSAIFAGRSRAQDYSKRLADSAIFAAISMLNDGNVNLDQDIRYQPFPDKPEIYATLTFDAGSEGPYSTNNLVSSTKKIGWNGQAVPPKFCHLVAVGHHYGYTIVRQAVIKDPPFPYSLASAGRIEGEQLEVFGLADGQYGSLRPGENLVIEEEDKVPSHIVSNESSAGQSIVLGSDTTVSGDVKATGNIDVGPAVIQGVVRPNSAAQNLPTVNIKELNPEGKPYAYKWDNSSEVTGRAHHEGNLEVSDLKLSEGLLFVKGDLTVTGEITGKGVLVATGKITITGSMDTQADNAALVAGGDITVRGQGPASSRFQGLVYSEGSVNISKTTVIGATVSKDSAGLTRFEEVRAIHAPELMSYKMEIHATLEKAKESGHSLTGGGTSAPIGIQNHVDGTFTRLAPNPDTAALQALAANIATTPEGTDTWQFGAMEGGTFTTSPTNVGFGFGDAKDSWDDYLQEHATDTVDRAQIIDIDLNSLITADQDLEVLFHQTVYGHDEN